MTITQKVAPFILLLLVGTWVASSMKRIAVASGRALEVGKSGVPVATRRLEDR